MPFYYKSHGKEAPNGFVAFARRIYNPLGFKRGYNFPLWVILAGAALGFCASRAMYLDYDETYGKNKRVTGDWEHQAKGLGRTGMLMHLACVVPIGFLLPWQFLPVVRHRAIWLHRVFGYLLILLLLGGNVGAIIVAPMSFGGSLDIRTLVGVLAIMTTGSALLAWINIRRLQIDQHRNWMLRTWAYAFIIITQRLMMLAASPVVSRVGGMYAAMACSTIDSIGEIVAPNLSAVYYPECEGAGPGRTVAVLADMNPEPTAEGLPQLHHIAATLRLVFPVTVVLAVLLHAFAVETYIHLTPHEAARLKRVSRERQLAKGYRLAGDSSFLTAEALGDAEPFNYGEQAAAEQEKLGQAGSGSSEGGESERRDS